MKNVKLPSRPAPSIQEAQRNNQKCHLNGAFEKKKPPPRPPPPNFGKAKSKSAWNLNQPDNTISLIEWSPPSSPKNLNRAYNGSISSSFSSSTSSLASSKRSFEYESVNNQNPWNTNTPFPFPTYGLQAQNEVQQQQQQHVAPVKIQPTIIRPQPPRKKNILSDKAPLSGGSRDVSPLPIKTDDIISNDDLNVSIPMPTIPPPSPPKDFTSLVSPFGIALYDYNPVHKDDLQLQVDDIVYLIRKISDDWLYGRVGDREGLFPSNFIEIHVPLDDDDNIVTALYEFQPQMMGDLELKPGQKIKITKRISPEWLMGESNGKSGQFPANFVDRLPNNI